MLFGAAIVLLVVLRACAVEVVHVHESSMLPTLHDGDTLVIDRLTYHFRGPRVGEVVVARVPGTGRSVVKRVAAVAGDVVGILDGRVERNGVVVDPRTPAIVGDVWGPVTVPAGAVFLLGDNRVASVDSRDFGAVPVVDVDGRVVLRVWPWGR